MIDKNHPELSIRRQCELLDLNRSTYYLPTSRESDENLKLMRMIDEEYMKAPFYGYRRMTERLHRQTGAAINPKRTARLMRIMGLQAIYPKKNTSFPDRQHKKYPYLLRNVKIDYVDQVWAADITYVPIKSGFMYLTAIMEWYSRYVLSWELSNTLESSFCVSALQQALQQGKPEIFNTDQGSQFTADVFTSVLEAAKIQISMDGKGRAFDNIFIERLWRSVKYEDLYINAYETVPDLYQGLSAYFLMYNLDRPHQALDYRTPAEVYFGVDRGAEVAVPVNLNLVDSWSS